MIIIKNIAWAEFEHSMQAVFGKTFVDADDLYFNIKKEVKFGEETELSDIQALTLLQDLSIMCGQLFVITDYCYEKNCGPFVMDASELNGFVRNFQFMYGEAFYSTDIIIISLIEKKIWVLFHEGICWVSKN